MAASDLIHEALSFIPAYETTKGIAGTISHELGYDVEPFIDQAVDVGVDTVVEFFTNAFKSKTKKKDVYYGFVPVITTCTLRITDRSGKDNFKQALMFRIFNTFQSSKANRDEQIEKMRTDPEQYSAGSKPCFVMPLTFDLNVPIGPPYHRKNVPTLPWWIGFVYGINISEPVLPPTCLMYCVPKSSNPKKQWLSIESYYDANGLIQEYNSSTPILCSLEDTWTEKWDKTKWDPRPSVTGAWFNLGTYSSDKSYHNAAIKGFNPSKPHMLYTSFFPFTTEVMSLVMLWSSIFGIHTGWSPKLPKKAKQFTFSQAPVLELNTNKAETTEKWVKKEAEKVQEDNNLINQDLEKQFETKEEETGIGGVLLGAAAIGTVLTVVAMK